MSEKTFDRKYEPIELNGGGLTRNHDELDPAYADDHHVWSVIECDGKCTLSPGYHVVNLIGYVQTKNPWTDEDDTDGLWVKYD
jgi:hypothetical protein